MRIPGFSAEASLSVTVPHGVRTRGRRRARGGVRPADYLDRTCYNACFNGCVNQCIEDGGYRWACVQQCGDQNSCRPLCTRPGDPPPPVVSQCTSGSFQYPWLAYCASSATDPGQDWTAYSNKAVECATVDHGFPKILNGSCSGIGNVTSCVTMPSTAKYVLGQGTSFCLF